MALLHLFNYVVKLLQTMRSNSKSYSSHILNRWWETDSVGTMTGGGGATEIYFDGRVIVISKQAPRQYPLGPVQLNDVRELVSVSGSRTHVNTLHLCIETTNKMLINLDVTDLVFKTRRPKKT